MLIHHTDVFIHDAGHLLILSLSSMATILGSSLRFIYLLLILFITTAAHAQPVTGVWEGRILFPQGALSRPYTVELHIERTGDSLQGYCYYHTGIRDYVKVPVRGYFNPYDGTVTWWHTDGTAVDPQGRQTDARVGGPVQFETDFNCPGEGIMKLDGKGVTGNGRDRGRDFAVHLRKTDRPYIPDEQEMISAAPSEPEKPAPPVASPPISEPTPPVVVRTTAPPEKVNPAPVGMEALFRSRTKTFVGEIPVAGDSLSLDFYDNAQIDGDSISIFLDGQMIATHILLKAKPHTISIPVSRLAAVSELTMVAENLGSIPPNTSLMIAYVNGVRHEIRLESTEQTSATIRLRKAPRTP